MAKLDGTHLALGVVAAVAAAGALAQRRGSRDHGALPTARYAALAASLREFEHNLVHPYDLREALRSWAQANGVTFLGSGAHRRAFRVPEGVLKISTRNIDHDRMYGNLAESRVWSQAPANIRKHLVPVLATAENGAWMLQEYAPTTGRERTPKEARNADAMWRAMTRCGYADFQPDNIADDGRLLDYGSAEYPERWKRCVEKAAAKGSLARKPKPRTLVERGLPTVWFHGTKIAFTGKLKPNRGMGGACVWLADAEGARRYAGNRPTSRVIEVELAPDTRVVDLSDVTDPIVREFIRQDARARNLFWHFREDVTDAEMADAVTSWQRQQTDYDRLELWSWSRTYFRQAGADALIVRDVAGWGGTEPMRSLCILNRARILREQDTHSR